ncbi:MAG: helix-turn-helix domain-containing protein, partial [Peptostreptococcaceae bacterium]|nr:helix-turn-helix domain-containing protein [Peptostreptococcaceae bacterium]
MGKENIARSYYAIIPANVRYDEDLTPNSKLLYGEITALCNEKGYCWASNDYFANLYKTTTRTVSRWIQQLISKGYISSKMIYREGTKEVKERYIYLGCIGGDKNVSTYGQKCHEGIDKNVSTPHDKNVQDNNTLFNNTVNNTTTIEKDVVADMIKKYFEFNDKEIYQIKKTYLEKNVGIDYLEEKLILTKNNPNIKNVIGYLINALKNDYKNSITQPKCFIPQ